MSTPNSSQHSIRRWRHFMRHRPVSGFTLVELMIGMLLGLIVIAGVISVFLATQQSYRTNEALGDVQDSSRIAFELMAHDIRNAGLTGCSNNHRLGNTLNNGPANGKTVWWALWNSSNENGIRGYGSGTTADAAGSGSNSGVQVASTDSLMLLGTADQGLTVSSYTDATHFSITQSTSTELQTGDVAIICDPSQATIFQVTANVAGSASDALEHGVSGNPGNCTQGLEYHTVCTTIGNTHEYLANAQISKLTAVDWYLGTNPVGGTSLYRVSLVNVAGTPTPTAAEMVRDVTGMALSYLQAPMQSFVTATKVTDWSAVNAVQVLFTVQSSNKRAGTGATAISRKFTATTNLRNRVN